MTLKEKIKSFFSKKNKNVVESVKEKVEQNTLVEQKKFDEGMKKSSSLLNESINEVLKKTRAIDDSLFEKIEEMFISFDINYSSCKKIINSIIEEIKIQNIKNVELIKQIIIDKLIIYYIQDTNINTSINLKPNQTNTILISGVNGVGKTTSIAKLANYFKSNNYSVCLIAADTFRAGAVAQLDEWSKKLNIPIFKPQKEGQDAASIVYSGLSYAKQNNIDIALIDTSGRLQNKINLMNELKKIDSVIKKFNPNQPVESLLVLDAISGQNGLFQAKSFSEITKLTGIILTKMDSSSKGGIVLSIKDVLNLPIKFIGFGEKIDDLKEFDLESFIIGLTESISL
ncbi:MAG: signal recognition particle-docking protein FtsY [Mycoplasmataceae bacterium]|jgi:fused signal recognition particle receptor|nr:signal recognition particle-docking protein FtsY [Mycoplasmataceae bacterium]